MTSISLPEQILSQPIEQAGAVGQDKIKESQGGPSFEINLGEAITTGVPALNRPQVKKSPKPDQSETTNVIPVLPILTNQAQTLDLSEIQKSGFASPDGASDAVSQTGKKPGTNPQIGPQKDQPSGPEKDLQALLSLLPNSPKAEALSSSSSAAKPESQALTSAPAAAPVKEKPFDESAILAKLFSDLKLRGEPSGEAAAKVQSADGSHRLVDTSPLTPNNTAYTGPSVDSLLGSFSGSAAFSQPPQPVGAGSTDGRAKGTIQKSDEANAAQPLALGGEEFLHARVQGKKGLKQDFGQGSNSMRSTPEGLGFSLAEPASELKLVVESKDDAKLKPALSKENLHEVGQRIKELAQDGKGDFRIRLKPESLGELHVRVMTQGDQVKLIVQASDDKAKSILESGLQSLKEGLAQHHLVLNQVDISTQPGSHFSALHGGTESGFRAPLEFNQHASQGGGQKQNQDSHRGESIGEEFRVRPMKTSQVSGVASPGHSGRIDIRV